jgi:hypothetical protein
MTGGGLLARVEDVATLVQSTVARRAVLDLRCHSSLAGTFVVWSQSHTPASFFTVVVSPLVRAFHAARVRSPSSWRHPAPSSDDGRPPLVLVQSCSVDEQTLVEELTRLHEEDEVLCEVLFFTAPLLLASLRDVLPRVLGPYCNALVSGGTLTLLCRSFAETDSEECGARFCSFDPAVGRYVCVSLSAARSASSTSSASAPPPSAPSPLVSSAPSSVAMEVDGVDLPVAAAVVPAVSLAAAAAAVAPSPPRRYGTCGVWQRWAAAQPVAILIALLGPLPPTSGPLRLSFAARLNALLPFLGAGAPRPYDGEAAGADRRTLVRLWGALSALLASRAPPS